MKDSFQSVLPCVALLVLPIQAQQVYVGYDQVAPAPGNPDYDYTRWAEVAWIVSEQAPQITQSFTPFTGGINFIDLALYDRVGDGLTPRIWLVLRSGSMDGPIIASTDPIVLAEGYRNEPGEWTRFVFPSTVYIGAYRTYCFQPVTEPGTGICLVVGGHTMYTAGFTYLGDEVKRGFGVFFREGEISVIPDVPEPSTLALAIISLPLLAWAGRRQTRRSA